MIRKCISSSSLFNIEGYNEELPQFKKKRTEKTIGGKCSCGAVQISVLSAKPLSSYFCHCKRCRKGKKKKKKIHKKKIFIQPPVHVSI